MDCKFTENVSRLIDGELTDGEARQIRLHLSDCAICQQAEEDFLGFRQTLQEYRFEPDLKAQQRAINNIFKVAPIPFWRRRIALPVPALALIFLLVIALGWWAIALRFRKPSATTTKVQPARTEKNDPTSATVFDLSRFDKGERAVIYTTRRAQPENLGQ
jgi:hypothetical protein